MARDTKQTGASRDDDDETLSMFAEAMRRRGRPVRVIDFPGVPNLRVGLWCPTEADISSADVESRKYLTKTLGLTALELSLAQETELAQREREIELLASILRDPNDAEQAFADSANDLRDHLEEEQRKALIAAVNEFRRSRFVTATAEESADVIRLVRSLKINGAVSTYWMSCDFDTQVFILDTLISALPVQTAPTSSAT